MALSSTAATSRSGFPTRLSNGAAETSKKAKVAKGATRARPANTGLGGRDPHPDVSSGDSGRHAGSNGHPHDVPVRGSQDPASRGTGASANPTRSYTSLVGDGKQRDFSLAVAPLSNIERNPKAAGGTRYFDPPPAQAVAPVKKPERADVANRVRQCSKCPHGIGATQDYWTLDGQDVCGHCFELAFPGWRASWGRV